jgi:hypothetical protein
LSDRDSVGEVNLTGHAVAYIVASNKNERPTTGGRARMKAARVRRAGRPPAGIDGKPSSQYPQLAVRVPPETIRQLTDIATARDIPQWQVVREAVARYHRQNRRRRKTDR